MRWTEQRKSHKKERQKKKEKRRAIEAETCMKRKRIERARNSEGEIKERRKKDR